jgi:hypothetical protein
VLVRLCPQDLVAGSGISFDDRGTHELKGVPDELAPVRGDDSVTRPSVPVKPERLVRLRLSALRTSQRSKQPRHNLPE